MPLSPPFFDNNPFMELPGDCIKEIYRARTQWRVIFGQRQMLVWKGDIMKDRLKRADVSIAMCHRAYLKAKLRPTF